MSQYQYERRHKTDAGKRSAYYTQVNRLLPTDDEVNMYLEFRYGAGTQLYTPVQDPNESEGGFDAPPGLPVGRPTRRLNEASADATDQTTYEGTDGRLYRQMPDFLRQDPM